MAQNHSPASLQDESIPRSQARIGEKWWLANVLEKWFENEGHLIGTCKSKKEVFEEAELRAKNLLGEEPQAYSIPEDKAELDPFFEDGGSLATNLVGEGVSLFRSSTILKFEEQRHPLLPWMQKGMRRLPVDLATGQRIGILVSQGHPKFSLSKRIAQHFLGALPSDFRGRSLSPPDSELCL